MSLGSRAIEVRSSLVVGVGALVTGFGIIVVVVLAAATYDLSGALLVAPVLILITLPMLIRAARREGDPRLLWILLAALVVKLIGAVAIYYISFNVYGGVADAAGYHLSGVDIAARLQAGDLGVVLESLSGTDFIRLLTGITYAIIGPTRLGGFLVFAWFSFLGMLLFYRAFRLGVPEGRRSTYLALLFFLPSMLFWPSTIGKEAWMLLTLGIAAVGAARLLSGRTWRGILIAGIGLWLGALVRPHVAGLFAVALVAGYLLKRSRRDLGVLGPIVKAIVLGALIVLAFILVSRTDRFLHEATGFSSSGNAVAVLRETSERTSIGGSQFGPSILDSPARAPIAAATVLFRPHLLEVDSFLTLAAALETTFLLALTLIRWRWWLSAVGASRRLPYVALALAFVALFILGFSAIANFGLLARERVQMLPLFLVGLCVPPRTSTEEPAEPDD